MDAQFETTEKTMLLYLTDSLVEAQRELDELTLQLALGKAEARDKFEDVKSQFGFRLANLKITLVKQQPSVMDSNVIAKWHDLEKRLNTGVVENKEMFAAQRKLIMKSLHAFEAEIKRKIPNNLNIQYFDSQIENFKLKMEILRLRFVLKRFAIQENLKDNLDEVGRQIARLTNQARSKINRGKSRFASIKRKITKTF